MDICSSFSRAKFASGMYQVIASSFFHSKSCVLPGIGRLQLITHPAETDFANARILSPKQEIVFIASNEKGNIFNEFSALSELMLQKLQDQDCLEIHGIGTFYQTAGGIQFNAAAIDADLLQPVPAVRVVHKDATHQLLVGDQEKSSVEMVEYFSEAAPVKDRWRIWALALAVLAGAAIGWYIYLHGINQLANTLPF